MGATEGETFKIENKKDKLSLNMQSGSSQIFVQRQINVKQVPNKKGKGNRQTFFQIRNSSINFSFREVMDRENKRRKRETNVLETVKNEERKRDNRWTNLWAKGHTEVTHAWKRDKLKSFFWYKRKVKLLFKKTGDQEKKRSNIKGNEKKLKAKRDEQKQKVTKKGWEKRD